MAAHRIVVRQLHGPRASAVTKTCFGCSAVSARLKRRMLKAQSKAATDFTAVMPGPMISHTLSAPFPMETAASGNSGDSAVTFCQRRLGHDHDRYRSRR